MTGKALDELHLQVEELRASRERVVAAADAERRLLERAIHDTVQQHLVALAVNVQLARQLADSDPPGATAQLEQMAHDIREALESVRQIAQRIYPPLLVDRGLAEALAGAAASIGIPTRVDVTGLERYPDGIEGAVYFLCLEALQGVADTGSAARATVRVWEERSQLQFEVTADPRSEAETPPLQLTSAMSDRIGALGGRLAISVDSAQRARLHGAIPLPQ